MYKRQALGPTSAWSGKRKANIHWGIPYHTWMDFAKRNPIHMPQIMAAWHCPSIRQLAKKRPLPQALVPCR